jgi:hypothetical protein
LFVNEVKNFLRKAKRRPFGRLFSKLFHRMWLTLNLDLDIYTGRKFNSLQGIDGLVVGLHDVDEALVNAHLEVLA